MGRLTNTQKNTLAYAQQCIGVAIKREAAWASRGRPSCTYLWVNDLAVRALDTLFSHIASFTTPPTGFGKTQRLSGWHREILKGILASMCSTSVEFQSCVLTTAIEEMHKHAVEYDMLSHMPRVRRTRKKRVPQTLVEARASKVDEKVREWERKLKYAKTKLSAYRKKQKYYTKKGEVV